MSTVTSQELEMHRFVASARESEALRSKFIYHRTKLQQRNIKSKMLALQPMVQQYGKNTLPKLPKKIQDLLSTYL